MNQALPIPLFCRQLGEATLDNQIYGLRIKGMHLSQWARS